MNFLAFVVDHSNYIGDAWVVTSAIFQENTVEGGVYGVYFEYSDYPIQLISNSVADTTHSAMTLVNVTAGSLVENYLIKNHGRGIEIIDGGNLSLTDNVVQDNHGDGLYISSALNVVIINGYYVDNTYVGIRTVNGTTVNWNVDGESSLAGNDAYFTGHIYVLDGGVLTIDLCDLKIYDGTDGTTLIQVDQGGQLIATNVVFDCEGFPGLFNVYGKLSMLSCTVEYWYELYLAPTSEASISGSMFIAQDRYGVYIDNCSPRIANCLFSGNELAGVFINGKAAAPSIELNVFLLNARGIYAENANLGDVVSNIFAVNYEAGIYGDSVTGRISANTFVLNKVEIYLTDSTVTISDNEIGWSHMIDVAATYSPVAAVIVNYVAEMTNIHLNLTGLVTSTAMPTASGFTTYASYVAALLVNHDGIMAYNSTLTCANNMYGLVSWAVHVEDSVLIFSDTVQSNNLVLKWLNSDLKSTNITVPVTAFNGIYARDSKVTIDNAVIQVLDTAVFLSSSTAKITDSKLLADQYDVYAVGNSSVTASGTVFDGKVKAVGDAQVSAEFQLDILTTDSNGNIVTGVTVTVKNNQGVIVATGKSDDTGHFKCSVVAYKIVNGNVDDSMNPYTVTVSFNNGDVTSSVTMTDATALTVAANADHHCSLCRHRRCGHCVPGHRRGPAQAPQDLRHKPLSNLPFLFLFFNSARAPYLRKRVKWREPCPAGAILMNYSELASCMLKAANAQEGDTLKVEASGREYQGILMPHHEFSDPNVLVLKMKSGYNVGVRIDPRSNVSVVSHPERKEKPVRHQKHDPALKTIAVIGTGGTIASYVDYRTGAVHPALSGRRSARGGPGDIHHMQRQGQGALLHLQREHGRQGLG